MNLKNNSDGELLVFTEHKKQKPVLKLALIDRTRSRYFTLARNVLSAGFLSLFSYDTYLNNYSRIDVSEEYFLDKKVIASAFEIKTEAAQSPKIIDAVADTSPIELLKQKNLEYFSNLEDEKQDYLVVVDKSSQTAKTYSLELKLVDTALVSTGRSLGDKEKEGDLKTPNGVFSVVDRENSSSWVHDGKQGVYGNYFFRLDAGSWDAQGNHSSEKRSSIGLHGTSEPQKLGSAASEGCVRFSNEKNVEYSKKGILKKGTIVAIIEPKKNSVYNFQEEVFKPKMEGVYNGIKAKSN